MPKTPQEKREDEVLLRMLKTKPKPHAAMTKNKPKPTTAKAKKKPGAA